MLAPNRADKLLVNVRLNGKIINFKIFNEQK